MRPHRFLGWGAIALGIGIAANAVLGPLVLEVMVHRAAPSTVSQIVGGDAAALVVIAPFSVIAGVLALRGHRAAPLCVMGPAVYAAYTAMQLAIGQEARSTSTWPATWSGSSRCTSGCSSSARR